MEIEAWFLADHSLFSKIDESLTPEYIKTKLGLDLINDDPEKECRHPAKDIDNILCLKDYFAQMLPVKQYWPGALKIHFLKIKWIFQRFPGFVIN